MKCQTCFLDKIRKNISVCHLLKMIPSMLSIKVYQMVYFIITEMVKNNLYFALFCMIRNLHFKLNLALVI